VNQFVAVQSDLSFNFPVCLILGCNLGMMNHQFQFFSRRIPGQELVVGKRNNVA
jgi:hypothetical protein